MTDNYFSYDKFPTVSRPPPLSWSQQYHYELKWKNENQNLTEKIQAQKYHTSWNGWEKPLKSSPKKYIPIYLRKKNNT
jgi:hypothetical protein